MKVGDLLTSTYSNFLYFIGDDPAQKASRFHSGRGLVLLCLGFDENRSYVYFLLPSGAIGHAKHSEIIGL